MSDCDPDVFGKDTLICRRVVAAEQLDLGDYSTIALHRHQSYTALQQDDLDAREATRSMSNAQLIVAVLCRLAIL